MALGKKRLNYELILLARDYRNLTQNQLSKDLNITQGTLSKIENGILPVYEGDSLASEISTKLNFPIKFFLQNISYDRNFGTISYPKRLTNNIVNFLDFTERRKKLTIKY